jgi:uncharacterized membrane protein YhaH (DUF805 family)
MNHYMNALKNYVGFEGRASRAEYWTFVLINFAIVFAIGFVSGLLKLKVLAMVAQIFNLAVLLPTIAAGVRRMHDTGRPGWWILVPIANLIFALQAGEPNTNDYGPVPE